MIESILEHLPWNLKTPLNGGTLSTTSGSTAVVGVGTNFVADVAVSDIITLTDDAGVFRTYQVASITDATNLVLAENALSAATGVSYETVPQAERTTAFFKADNAVPKKPIISVPLANSGVLNSAGLSLISINEGVLVKSVYLRLPYQYPMADTPIALNFNYLSSAGANLGIITAFGNNTLYINNENIEIPVNTYVPPPSNTTGTWQIGITINAALSLVTDIPSQPYDVPQISQVDGPDMLNGLYLPIYPGIRILHGFALT